MGNRTHSPELVVARLPIVAHILVITHVLVVTHVLAVTCVLAVPRVRSCVLAVICEPRWPFWLVVVPALRGSWAMVKGARWWVVVVGCGQRTVAGMVHVSWALVLTWLVTWPATSLLLWLVVVVSGW